MRAGHDRLRDKGLIELGQAYQESKLGLCKFTSPSLSPHSPPPTHYHFHFLPPPPPSSHSHFPSLEIRWRRTKSWDEIK